MVGVCGGLVWFCDAFVCLCLFSVSVDGLVFSLFVVLVVWMLVVVVDSSCVLLCLLCVVDWVVLFGVG